MTESENFFLRSFSHAFSSIHMFIDIAANLTDEMFQGIYHDKKRHDSDLHLVIERAKNSGCNQMIILAGSLEDAKECMRICSDFDPSHRALFTTIGVHPTRCDTLLTEPNLAKIFHEFIDTYGDRVAAFGELGLDYDRLHFCSKEIQIRGFESQLQAIDILKQHNIQRPLLLHLRNAFDDFVLIMEKYKHVWENCGGVVHSFTGTQHEMKVLTDMGLYIGLNGCSLRSDESLSDVVPFIPDEKILLETDAPYCDVRPTHPGYKYLSPDTIPKNFKPEKFQPGSMVKGRNEPACISQIAAIVAKARKTDRDFLINKVHENTLRLFKHLARRYPAHQCIIQYEGRQNIFYRDATRSMASTAKWSLRYLRLGAAGHWGPGMYRRWPTRALATVRTGACRVCWGNKKI